MKQASPIRIMGIVNLTDDSYYAPSRLLGAGREHLVGHVGAMVAEGMDILDGCLYTVFWCRDEGTKIFGFDLRNLNNKRK